MIYLTLHDLTEMKFKILKKNSLCTNNLSVIRRNKLIDQINIPMI